MKLKLTIKDRLNLSSLCPKSSTLEGMVLVKDIQKAIEFTKKEVIEINFKTIRNPQNPEIVSYQWNREKEREITIDLDKSQVELLQKQIKVLDEQEKISESILDLCIKINNLK